ncbi:hypothetical protein Pla22_34050 [Rubripirellula amarantea]|uniref:Uncharacterized protein n=1 Tax=Rubripirellula amarantea TaxID=2527999 RepID=A0A5C5WLK8_9BACT|nr:hypothetical protein Pla22_34050 [Rubripirellula amarantea]
MDQRGKRQNSSYLSAGCAWNGYSNIAPTDRRFAVGTHSRARNANCTRECERNPTAAVKRRSSHRGHLQLADLMTTETHNDPWQAQLQGMETA